MNKRTLQKQDMVQEEEELLRDDDLAETEGDGDGDDLDDEEEVEDEDFDDEEEDLEEATANADTLRPKSKMAMMAQAVNMLAGMKKEDLSFMLDQAMAKIGHEADVIPSGTAEKNKASVAMKESIKEDLQAVFGEDQQLSEEFKQKIETLFEATVGARVSLIEAELQEQFEQKLVEQTEAVVEGLAEKLDQYLQYVAETWLEENQVAVQSTLRSEITEEFISDLKDLFIEHNISVPEEQSDIVEQLAEQLEETEKTNQKLFEENKQLADYNFQLIKGYIVEEYCDGMVQSSAEKFKSLAEHVDFEGNVEEFTAKLDTILESYFPEHVVESVEPASTGLINEEIDFDAGEEQPGSTQTNLAPEMKLYASAISRTLKNK